MRKKKSPFERSTLELILQGLLVEEAIPGFKSNSIELQRLGQGKKSRKSTVPTLQQVCLTPPNVKGQLKSKAFLHSSKLGMKAVLRA